MKTLIRKLFNLFFIRNPIKTYTTNKLIIDTLLKSSRIKVIGKLNYISIKDSKLKRLRIDISGNNNIINIGEMNRITNFNIMIVGDYHEITIGNNTDILGANFISCGNNNKIILGNDNLIAGDVELRNCDGHSIIQNGQILNHNEPIIIGNRVWLCARTTILKGVTINDDTVVGIGSLVTKGIYPSNIILGGIPAKILKSNIRWDGSCPP